MMSPSVAGLFSAFSNNSSSSPTHPPPIMSQPAPPSYSSPPYPRQPPPPPPSHSQPPLPPPQPQVPDGDDDDSTLASPSIRPGRPLLSRWSTTSLTSSPYATLLTTEIGSFPRQLPPAFSTGRVIAANRHFVCYSVANGHIRVIGASSGKTALLKGHSGAVLDLELRAGAADGEGMLASVSSGGEVFVWRMQHTGEGELSTGVLGSWRRAADVKDSHYRRVMWWRMTADGTPGLMLVSSSSVDSLQLTGALPTPALVELSDAPSFVRMYSGAGVSDAALTAEGKKLAVALSRGAVDIVDTDGGAAERAVESTISIGEGAHRLFFLSSWAASQPALPTAVLLVCSIRADHSSFTLVHAFTRRTLSAVVLNHPGHSLTSACLDPTSSFLLLSHTSADRGEHGLVALHIRKQRDVHLEDVRFDYLTLISTSSAVLSFSLTNDGPNGPAHAVAWDDKTVDEVQLYCCTTKPIVQFHMRTDAVMRKVEELELLEEEKYPEPAQPPQHSHRANGDGHPQPPPSEPASSAPAAGPGLLTPQAIRAASATSSPASSPAAFPTTASATVGVHPVGGRLSITLSAPSPPSSSSSSSASSSSSTAAPLATPLKILQRPPAINSAVLPISTGSPSSSPTTSHHTAAALITPSRASPEVPETPASSPNAGTLQPHPNLAKLTQQPGVLTFAPLAAAAAAPQSVQASRKDGHSEHSLLPSTPPTEERKSHHHHASKRRESKEPPRAAVAADESAVLEGEASSAGEEVGAGKERRRDTQEANLLARLDKLFARHLTKVNALVQTQVERTLTTSKDEMEKDRKERGGVEKQRTEGLLKAVTQSLQGPSGAAGPQQMEAAVERALARSFSQTLIPQVNSAISSAISSSSMAAPDVDVEALSSLVVQSLRSPLQDAFKSTFSSVLLPGFEASTRAMFKQIENVYARMSESNEHMLREKVEDILQQRGAGQADERARQQQQQQREDELKAIHSALTSLVQSNQTLQRSLTAMQQQQEQQHSTIAELRALLQQQPHPPSTAPSVAAAAPKAAAAASAPSDYKAELGLLLQQRAYETAFTRALSLGKVPPVTWLCSQLDPIPLLHPANPAHRLSPAVLLSLIQQLGFNLRDEAELKLLWVKECLLVLDRSDSIIRPHVPDVLRGVLGRVEEQLNAAWKEPAYKQLSTQGRTVQHLITASLEQM